MGLTHCSQLRLQKLDLLQQQAAVSKASTGMQHGNALEHFGVHLQDLRMVCKYLKALSSYFTPAMLS